MRHYLPPLRGLLETWEDLTRNCARKDLCAPTGNRTRVKRLEQMIKIIFAIRPVGAQRLCIRCLVEWETASHQV